MRNARRAQHAHSAMRSRMGVVQGMKAAGPRLHAMELQARIVPTQLKEIGHATDGTHRYGPAQTGAGRALHPPAVAGSSMRRNSHLPRTDLQRALLSCRIPIACVKRHPYLRR